MNDSNGCSFPVRPAHGIRAKSVRSEIRRSSSPLEQWLTQNRQVTRELIAVRDRRTWLVRLTYRYPTRCRLAMFVAIVTLRLWWAFFDSGVFGALIEPVLHSLDKLRW